MQCRIAFHLEPNNTWGAIFCPLGFMKLKTLCCQWKAVLTFHILSRAERALSWCWHSWVSYQVFLCLYHVSDNRDMVNLPGWIFLWVQIPGVRMNISLGVTHHYVSSSSSLSSIENHQWAIGRTINWSDASKEKENNITVRWSIAAWTIRRTRNAPISMPDRRRNST